MPLSDFLHAEVAHIQDEPLKRQTRVDSFEHNRHALDFPFEHFFADRLRHFRDVTAYLRMTGLVDGYAVCPPASKGCRWVDLAHTEDRVQHNLN